MKMSDQQVAQAAQEEKTEEQKKAEQLEANQAVVKKSHEENAKLRKKLGLSHYGAQQPPLAPVPKEEGTEIPVNPKPTVYER